jgi:hypothetical protein
MADRRYLLKRRAVVEEGDLPNAEAGNPTILPPRRVRIYTKPYDSPEFTMNASTFRSALQIMSAKMSGRRPPGFSVDEVIEGIYMGLFNREPDSSGARTFRHFLQDGLQNGTLKIAEMVRSCIGSPEFSAIRPVEAHEPIGIIATEAEAVFGSFVKYQNPGRSGYVTNFLGGITDVRFSSGIETLAGLVEGYPLSGNFHGGLMEWVGTLKSVLDANGAFRMLELGAGWAPWCAIAYLAAVQRGISDIQVIGVEGDVGHVGFIEEHFAANGLPPDTYSIIRGVVAVTDGEALFPKARDPSGVYGGAPGFSPNDDEQDPFNFFMKDHRQLVDQVERVSAFSLASLMAGLPVVDLVHCDIQGGELGLFTGAMDLISRKVKRFIIGTHSRQIDRGLLGLFASMAGSSKGRKTAIIITASSMTGPRFGVTRSCRSDAHRIAIVADASA